MDAIVRYSSGLLAAIFAAYDIRFLIPVIPLVGLSDIPVAAFCATDPPAVPTYTAAEATALLNLDFGPDFDSGLSKTKDLILHAIWWDACECTSGTPIGFIPPAPPTGTPITQFPIGETGVPCVTSIDGAITVTGTQSFNRGTANGVGRNVTLARVSVGNAIASGAGVSVRWDMEWQNQAVSPVTVGTTTSRTVLAGTTLVFDVPLSAGFDWLHLKVTALGGAGSSALTTRMDLYCDGARPDQPAQPCCPPDPSTQSYLDNILQLVTLIQRQIVPFAHVLGTVHSGLTGQGTIGVSGLLGVKLDLTTIPASYGVQVGSPNYHFDLGWLSVLTPDGFIDERRVTAQLVSWLPRLMSDATVVGYSLSPGVVGTITEIVREP